MLYKRPRQDAGNHLALGSSVSRGDGTRTRGKVMSQHSDTESLVDLQELCSQEENPDEMQAEQVVDGIECTPPHNGSAQEGEGNAEGGRVNEDDCLPFTPSQNSTGQSSAHYESFRSPEEIERHGSLADADRWKDFDLSRADHKKGLLHVPKGVCETMYAKSKWLYIQDKKTQQTQEESVVWSFVFLMKNTSIPLEAKKVIYFFLKMIEISKLKPLNGHCVSTATLKPQVIMPGKKITHIVSEKEDNETFENLEMDHLFGDDSGINLSKLVIESESYNEGKTKKRRQIFTINVNITGAVCQLDDDEIKHEPVCEVQVTSLTNVNPLRLIVDHLLASPTQSLAGFSAAYAENLELTKLLEEILLYQSSHVIGDTSGELPSTYYSDPTGARGISNICNPFTTPLKILGLLRKKYNHRLKVLKIIGFYDIDWLANPQTNQELNAYVKYNQAYVGEVRLFYNQIDQALNACNSDGRAKKKRARKGKGKAGEENVEDDLGDQIDGESQVFTPFFGFPLKKIPNNDTKHSWFVQFTRTLCPISMGIFNLCDQKGNFREFLFKFGDIPEAVKTVLMDFILFDYNYPDATGISDFFLGDPEEASMAKVIEKYHLKERSLLEGMATHQCLKPQYLKMTQFIRRSLELGQITIENAMEIWKKFSIYQIETFHGYVIAGQFYSDCIRQRHEMMASVAKAENSDKLDPLCVNEELLRYKDFIIKRRDGKNYIDPYTQSVEFLYGTLVHANQSMHLNALNLKNFLSIMCSILHFSMPRDSDTIPGIGQTNFLAPGCGTFTEKTQNNQTLPVVGCHNSAGKDFVPKLINDLFSAFCTLVGADDFQTCVQLSRTTEGSLEDAVSITFVNGKVTKFPEPKVVFTFCANTEMRGQLLKTILNMLIQWVVLRGNEQKTLSLSTGESAKGIREPLVREHPFRVQYGLLCTNQSAPDPETAEKLRTLQCVSNVICPGSTPFEHERMSSDFCDVGVHIAQTKNIAFEGQAERGVPLTLCLSHLYAFMEVNLPLYIGVGPFNTSPVVVAVMEFILFYIIKHLLHMFEPTNAKNYDRLKSVYTSRAASFSSWVYMLQGLTENVKKEDAFLQAREKLQFDAIGLTDVPAVAFETICRCLHWAPVILAYIFAKEVKMPIVPIDILKKLLNMDQPPTRDDAELFKWYNEINRWLTDCIHSGKFCPPSGFEQSSVVCEYISNGCLPDGSLARESMFRVNGASNGWKTHEGGKCIQESVLDKLVQQILFLYRPDLIVSCSFTEGTIPVAINDLFKFCVSLHKFLEIPQFDSERFLKFFRVWDLHSFRPYETDVGSLPPFAIKTAWFRSHTEAESAGVGIHVIQLLTLGALAGENAKKAPHPDMVYALGKGLVTQILEKLPGAAVPRKQIYIPYFNSNGYETIVAKSKLENPEHFVRPKDAQLAITGIPSQLPNIFNLAPEDLLHMPGVCGVAKHFGVKPWDLPPSVQNYFIRPLHVYCAYNKERCRSGTILYDNERVVFTHFPKNRPYSSLQVSEDEEDEDDAKKEKAGKTAKAKARDEDGSDQDSTGENEEALDCTQHSMESEEAASDDEDEEEKTCILPVKTWQKGLADKGFVLLPMITRVGACVTVADMDLGERVGVLVPPPENADFNFDTQKRCYCVRVANSRARNYVYMTPFEVFESLIPIGTELYLKLESEAGEPFMERIQLVMRPQGRAGFAIRVVMGTPNVFKPVPGRVYVNYLIKGDTSQKTEVICVRPSDLLIRAGERTVIKSVIA